MAPGDLIEHDALEALVGDKIGPKCEVYVCHRLKRAWSRLNATTWREWHDPEA